MVLFVGLSVFNGAWMNGGAWANRALAQRVQFSQGFSGAAQNARRDPAESSAYSAAVSSADPHVRASAIQQFLLAYPNSSFRQPAIDQMMLAKSEIRAAGANSAANPAGTAAAPTNAANHPPSAPSGAAPMAQAGGPPHDSLLQKAAKPAQVTVAPHALTIKADNSALSQILRDISNSTGMKVEGLAKDERIFGTYGPGDAHEVLLSLLQGSGYNVLMVGDADGQPRQLSLSQRTTTGTEGSTAAPRSGQSDEDEEIEQEVQQQPSPDPQQPQLVGQPLPGNPQNPQNPDGAQPRNGVEIQQEMLRRQQQIQQQQQNPQ